MYSLKEESKKTFKRLWYIYYAECLGYAPQYTSSLLNGSKMPKITAKALISVCFGVSFAETEKMEQLLNDYFEKTEDKEE